jgi:hypothetical protein
VGFCHIDISCDFCILAQGRSLWRCSESDSYPAEFLRRQRDASTSALDPGVDGPDARALYVIK